MTNLGNHRGKSPKRESLRYESRFNDRRNRKPHIKRKDGIYWSEATSTAANVALYFILVTHNAKQKMKMYFAIWLRDFGHEPFCLFRPCCSHEKWSKTCQLCTVHRGRQPWNGGPIRGGHWGHLGFVFPHCFSVQQKHEFHEGLQGVLQYYTLKVWHGTWKWWFQKESPFPEADFQVPCSFSRLLLVALMMFLITVACVRAPVHPKSTHLRCLGLLPSTVARFPSHYVAWIYSMNIQPFAPKSKVCGHVSPKRAQIPFLQETFHFKEKGTLFILRGWKLRFWWNTGDETQKNKGKGMSKTLSEV